MRTGTAPDPTADPPGATGGTGAVPVRWGTTVSATLGLLALANVMSNRVVPEAWYVPWNLAVAAALVVLVRRSTLTDAEVGFAEWRRGATFGAVLAVLTLAVMLLALSMPVFRELYRDGRVDDEPLAVAYQALVRVPFGTVVLEEVAFRAVLPGLFAVRFGVARGCLLASAVFGLWHVLPAWNLNDANQVAGDVFGSTPLGTAVAVGFAVVGTTVAGLWWCWIRYRARSVLATVIAHTATNSIGYLLAYTVTH